MLHEGDGRRGGQGGWRDGFTTGLHKVYLENEAHLPLLYNNNNSSSTWHLSLLLISVLFYVIIPSSFFDE